MTTHWRDVDPSLRNRYTDQEKIQVVHWFIDESIPASQIKMDQCYTHENIESLVQRAGRGESHSYPGTDTWVHAAMKKYVNDKDVVVIGSTVPWYEAMALNYGCRSCTAVEFQRRTCTSQRQNLRYITVAEFDQETLEGRQYDVVVSISSIEHDGLGRYGDPLDPDADIGDMAKAKQFLKANTGVMILAVPVGLDKVVWNAHRVYGRNRLPRLLSDWSVIQTYDINYPSDQRIDKDFGSSGGYQPVFILSHEIS